MGLGQLKSCCSVVDFHHMTHTTSMRPACASATSACLQLLVCLPLLLGVTLELLSRMWLRHCLRMGQQLQPGHCRTSCPTFQLSASSNQQHSVTAHTSLSAGS